VPELMASSESSSARLRTLAVLFPAFALTGILHTISGPLMPSMASTFHLGDSQSGFLFFLYFGGSSIGAILCVWNYARTIALGFLGTAVCCVSVATASRPMMPLIFLLLGIGVGTSMSAINLFVGRAYPERCAAILTFLNFIWSAGALSSPLIAARFLEHHNFQTAYAWLAAPSLLAAVASGALLRDSQESNLVQKKAAGNNGLVLIVVFAAAAFLQVGVENTSTAWLSTYVLREAGIGAALAAVATSFYWGGFLASRGVSSAVLLRVKSSTVFRAAIVLALCASLWLAVASNVMGDKASMLLLGVGLAPIYPLLIAEFMERSRHISEARWILATAGFGGSVTPWLAGWISSRTGSLRMGLLTIPASIVLIVALLPILRSPGRVAERGPLG
jgi:fucose permease